jgi:hypothetical protein
MQATESRLVNWRSEFHCATVELIGRTRQSLRLVDRDLSDWALEAPAAIAALERVLLSAGASLQIVVQCSDYLERDAPRLIALRRRFSDRVVVRLAPPALPVTEGLLVGDTSHVLRRASPEAWRGRLELASPISAEQWRRKFAALWDECGTELPPTTLGL